MRNLVFCLLILALDVVFTQISAGIMSVSGLDRLWQGVPLSVLAGVGGIVVLVILNFVISAIALPVRGSSK
jgi:hypothetical protein